MKKSLRFTAAGLSVCMMAAMLAGCSSSSSTDTTAAADASEAAADTQEAEAKTSDLSFAFCTNTLLSRVPLMQSSASCARKTAFPTPAWIQIMI